jgi:hypothetical protein
MSIAKLPRGAQHPKTRRRADYRPPAYIVDDIALEFDLDADATTVTAAYAFRRRGAQRAGAPDYRAQRRCTRVFARVGRDVEVDVACARRQITGDPRRRGDCYAEGRPSHTRASFHRTHPGSRGGARCRDIHREPDGAGRRRNGEPRRK